MATEFAEPEFSTNVGVDLRGAAEEDPAPLVPFAKAEPDDPKGLANDDVLFAEGLVLKGVEVEGAAGVAAEGAEPKLNGELDMFAKKLGLGAAGGGV